MQVSVQVCVCVYRAGKWAGLQVMYLQPVQLSALKVKLSDKRFFAQLPV